MSQIIMAGTVVAAILIAGACVKERTPVRKPASRQAIGAVVSVGGEPRVAAGCWRPSPEDLLRETAFISPRTETRL